MALYDAPVHNGYKILTHTSTRRFQTNGFSQVGNTTLPKNPINPTPVRASAIFNKNISLTGISEAGYGRTYPNYGLSGRSDPGGWGLVSGLRYPGAGSPRTSLAYSGAGSPRTSLAYSGAGSPRSSLQYSGAGSPRSSLKYSGAGSPRTSLMDSYINDNPPPGTLGKIGIRGRRNSIRGLADGPIQGPTLPDSTIYGDAVEPTDTGSEQGPTLPGTTLVASAPASTGFFDTISNAFSTLFTTTAATAAQAGQVAADSAISSAISGQPTTAQKVTTALATATNPTTILGLSTDTLLLIGLGVGAWYVMKK